MQGAPTRKAQFRTAICLILDGKKHLFERIVKVRLIKEKRGSSGFGYDPSLCPKDILKLLPELGNETKKQNQPPCAGRREALPISEGVKK